MSEVNSKIKFINKSDNEFVSIESEIYREYLYFGEYGFLQKIRIDKPLMLSVSKSNGHRVFAANGKCYYIPTGWVGIEWEVEEGAPHFVK